MSILIFTKLSSSVLGKNLKTHKYSKWHREVKIEVSKSMHNAMSMILGTLCSHSFKANCVLYSAIVCFVLFSKFKVLWREETRI